MKADLQDAGIKYRMERPNFDKPDSAITNGQPLGTIKLIANAKGPILGWQTLMN